MVEAAPGSVEIIAGILGLYRDLGIISVQTVVVIGLEILHVGLKSSLVASFRQIQVSSLVFNFPLFPVRIL